MIIVNLSLDKSKINPYLSSTLLKEIEKALKNNKKTILYLNKRGDFSSLVCQDCQYIYKCDNCDISLSVHKYPETLKCHLCGYSRNIPLSCNKCKGTHLLKIGTGTQQIETAIKKYFSKANIFRFDLDSMKNKKAKTLALENLYKADIIIGTKMITTGFDFKNLAVVGIILVEQELIIPNYNTEEKAYINLRQVIGRGNRLGEKSTLILQSFVPENPSVAMLCQANYKEFFLETLSERKAFNYPPFKQIAFLEYRHKNKQKALNFMENLKNKLDILNNKEFEITLNKSPRKKYNSYHYEIIIKGDNIRDFLKNIKSEIFRNSNLSLKF